MANIDFCKLTIVKSQQNLNALGQLDGVVAIATDSCGYSDVQGFRHGYNDGFRIVFQEVNPAIPGKVINESQCIFGLTHGHMREWDSCRNLGLQ